MARQLSKMFRRDATRNQKLILIILDEKMVERSGVYPSNCV